MWFSLVGAICVAFVYLVFQGPPRHRYHGAGHIDQAMDNFVGQFGKNYPEDVVQSEHGHEPQRNELCPCGSGLKYKRCCGLDSNAG